ncbi:MAG: YceI family protein [Nitrospinae bacterium]|nr:YceI family protein [Nitrospinota bacterium]
MYRTVFGLIFALILLGEAHLAIADEFKKYPLTPKTLELTYHFESGLHDFSGKAEKLTGYVLVPKDLDPSKYYTEVNVKSNSLVSGEPNRDARARDYSMEAFKYPLITFKSTSFNGIPNPIKPGESFDFNLKGVLTMKGISKMVHIPTKVTAMPQVFKVEGEIKIKWEDFGINEPMFINLIRLYAGTTIRLSFWLPYELFKEGEGTLITIGEEEFKALKESVPSKNIKELNEEEFTKEYTGKCTTLPEKYMPIALRKTVKNTAHISWDEGCKAEVSKRENVQRIVVSNFQRHIGKHLTKILFQCDRALSGVKGIQATPWSCKAIKKGSKVIRMLKPERVPPEMRQKPISCDKYAEEFDSEPWSKLAEMGLEIKKGGACMSRIVGDDEGICIPEGENYARESLLVSSRISDGRTVFIECERDAALMPRFAFISLLGKKCGWKEWFCLWTEKTWTSDEIKE